MCNFASFCVDKQGNIYVGDWHCHAGIEVGHKLKPDQYREAEWTEDDKGESLTVRVGCGEEENFYRALILGPYPTRKKLLASFKTGKTNLATYTFNSKGQLHSYRDKPAEICADDNKYWYKNDQLHRDKDKPAVIYADGTKCWFKNGLLHRDGDKPAIIYSNGSKCWYKNDQFIKEKRPK